MLPLYRHEHDWSHTAVDLLVDRLPWRAGGSHTASRPFRFYMPSWTPVLDHEQRQSALLACDEIAAALRVPYDSWSLTLADDPSGLRTASLASGRAGVALFFDYYARVRASREAKGDLIRMLNEAIDAMSASSMNASLYCGFTGVAWVTQHVGAAGAGDEDLNAPIDEVLLDPLSQAPWLDEFDLIGGLVGLGVYALERWPRASAHSLLTQIAARLIERMVDVDGKRAWPVSLPAVSGERPVIEAEVFNLGLSHGNPGAIALLALIARRGIATQAATRAVEDAVEWLAMQRLDRTQTGCFADFSGPDIERKPARLAWCYGDAGVAAALLVAARALKRHAWEEMAIEIAGVAAQRSVEDSRVVDGGLCHGAAGLAQIFMRLHHATKEPAFAEAARRWVAQLLEWRRTGAGVAGFSAFSFERVREGESIADPCWLTGAAGVGLTLLAAATGHEPLWDRVLLISPHDPA